MAFLSFVLILFNVLKYVLDANSVQSLPLYWEPFAQGC